MVSAVAGSPRCGNRVVDEAFGETCDDGNVVDGDGCSSTCDLECGNGVLNTDNPNYVETCDDGNAIQVMAVLQSVKLKRAMSVRMTHYLRTASVILMKMELSMRMITVSTYPISIKTTQTVITLVTFDNCVNTPNDNQDDADDDGRGDLYDNCVNDPNFDQVNTDGDDYGDLCDNCINDINNDQVDGDDDGAGDACDTCPGTDNTNSDNDTLCDAIDNCVNDDNENQTDTDQDGIGDACDACPEDPDNDSDNDGVCVTNDPATSDNCPNVSNPPVNGVQLDDDSDGVGDECDVCQGNTGHDHDEDGICSAANPPDNCPFDFNDGQENIDNDAFGDVCDDDRDGDGFPNQDEIDCGKDPDNAQSQIQDADFDGIQVMPMMLAKATIVQAIMTVMDNVTI